MHSNRARRIASVNEDRILLKSSSVGAKRSRQCDDRNTLNDTRSGNKPNSPPRCTTSFECVDYSLHDEARRNATAPLRVAIDGAVRLASIGTKRGRRMVGGKWRLFSVLLDTRREQCRQRCGSHRTPLSASAPTSSESRVPAFLLPYLSLRLEMVAATLRADQFLDLPFRALPFLHPSRRASRVH